jgi:hypothetical protein
MRRPIRQRHAQGAVADAGSIGQHRVAHPSTSQERSNLAGFRPSLRSCHRSRPFRSGTLTILLTRQSVKDPCHPLAPGGPVPLVWVV